MASGSAYSWVKNEICKIEQKLAEENGTSAYDYINEQVASAPLGANGVLFLPLLKGERSPFYNPKAKGSFLGITLANTRADLLRAVVEGIGFNIALILEDIRKYGNIEKLTMVGGLAKSDVRKFHAISAHNLPNMENHEKYKKILELYQKGYEAQVDLFDAMAQQ